MGESQGSKFFLFLFFIIRKAVWFKRLQIIEADLVKPLNKMSKKNRQLWKNIWKYCEQKSNNEYSEERPYYIKSD